MPKYKSTDMHIMIIGNIGTGKSTLLKALSTELNAKSVLESFMNTQDLYSKLHSQAFFVESFFLDRNIERHLEASSKAQQQIVIQDRGIYDVCDVFIRVMREMAWLSEEEYQQLRLRYALELTRLRPPDLIVYTHIDHETQIVRIKKRARKGEEDIRSEYLQLIGYYYEQLFEKGILSIPMLKIETNKAPETLAKEIAESITYDKIIIRNEQKC